MNKRERAEAFLTKVLPGNSKVVAVQLHRGLDRNGNSRYEIVLFGGETSINISYWAAAIVGGRIRKTGDSFTSQMTAHQCVEVLSVRLYGTLDAIKMIAPVVPA